MKSTTGAAILAELHAGPRSTSELMATIGVSRDAVSLAVRKLRRAGHHITHSGCTSRGRGGGSGAVEGVYRLAAPGNRSCAWPGCSEHLNRDNRGPHCLYHRRLAAVLYLAHLDDAVEDCEVWA